MISPVYWHPVIYSTLMKFLYGKDYNNRYEKIVTWIPDNVSVAELCAGFGDFYLHSLQHKKIKYTGYDINPTFINYGLKNKVSLRFLDINRSPVPKADIIIIQASLYQFYGESEILVSRMLDASDLRVIVSEPVRNFSDSESKFLSGIAKYLANPGDGHKTERFNTNSFSKLMNKFSTSIEYLSNDNGREMVCVLNKNMTG